MTTSVKPTESPRQPVAVHLGAAARHATPFIRIAKSTEDRQRVFRLRYEVYVEEMKRVQKHVNHQNRTVEEPFDANGHLLLAQRGEETLGTLRTNFARETDLGYYVSLFRLDSVGAAFPHRVSLTTKLMIRPDLRSGTLAFRLASAVYRYGLEQGIEHDFIDCNPHLEGFFQRLGFRTYMPKAVHPEYGEVLPLRLDLRDFDHLRRISSPFARLVA